MKALYFAIIGIGLSTLSPEAGAQQGNNQDVFSKVNNAGNKIINTISVFQPYLLKARQLFYDGKQLVGDVKNSAKRTLGVDDKRDTNQNQTYSSYSSNDPNGYNSNNNSGYSGSNNGSSSQGGYGNPYNNPGSTGSTSYNGNFSPQNYLPGQNLPISNPAVVNNDGSGNWGNQNNGLYGNCLDVMTGNVIGMGEAAQSPSSVDLLFFAPGDGQNAYYIMSPGFAKDNSSAGAMTQHASEQVQQWTDVNETEVALSKLTIGQFNQIQNNNQIQNAVRNAQDYSGYYMETGQKMDGKVFAVKVQMDNREVYALVAILKQFGTSGSNGYLKVQIKTTGLVNNNQQINVNAYIR